MWGLKPNSTAAGLVGRAVDTSCRDGAVEIDSAVYHAHTSSSGYATALWRGSWVTLNYNEAAQEAYHGEGAQVR